MGSDVSATGAATGRGEGRTIFVGDVHGCLDELQAVLRLAGVSSSDWVVLVGDLVAKGPDSQGVLALARERGFRAVLGNHDAKVLSLGRHEKESANDPERSEHTRVAATLTGDDWSYLEGLPLSLSLPEVAAIAVHGGLVPGVPLAEQPRKYLLNLRSITPTGEPSKRVDAGVPWASLWPGPEHVVFGHDAMRGLQRHPFATGLDTGCVYGGALSALVLPENRIISTPARRPYVAM
jgi:predicted phosphodiesterase